MRHPKMFFEFDTLGQTLPFSFCMAECKTMPVREAGSLDITTPIMYEIMLRWMSEVPLFTNTSEF